MVIALTQFYFLKPYYCPSKYRSSPFTLVSVATSATYMASTFTLVGISGRSLFSTLFISQSNYSCLINEHKTSRQSTTRRHFSHLLYSPFASSSVPALSLSRGRQFQRAKLMTTAGCRSRPREILIKNRLRRDRATYNNHYHKFREQER